MNEYKILVQKELGQNFDSNGSPKKGKKGWKKGLAEAEQMFVVLKKNNNNDFDNNASSLKKKCLLLNNCCGYAPV